MHRFRPILLTATAAILGMLPIAPTVFWGPMAYAIMGGLAVATLLTLVFLPALYVAWFRIKRPEVDVRSDAGTEARPPVPVWVANFQAHLARRMAGFQSRVRAAQMLIASRPFAGCRHGA